MRAGILREIEERSGWWRWRARATLCCLVMRGKEEGDNNCFKADNYEQLNYPID